MKNIKLSSIVVLLLTMLFITSCIDDEKDDFDAPDLTIVDPNIAEEDIISMNAIAGQLFNANLSNFFIDNYIDIFDDRNDIIPITFDETGNFISGYVISSDEAGNFFEELIIQDKSENPTFGIKINVNVNPLFTKFVLGRKVFIKLDGLSISVANGLLTLGVLDNNGRLEKISESLLDEFIIRSPELGAIIPKLIDLADPNLVLSTNQFVLIEDAQFNRNLIFPEPVTFAAETLDEFDGERLLESCIVEGTIILATSTFSDFISLTLPTGKGNIQGVLSQNFFGNTLNLNLNSPSDIMFNDDRCDPLELDCGLATTEGTNVIFTDDFESQSLNAAISGNGWTNYIEAGSQTWEAFQSTGGSVSYEESVSARVGSFQSGDASSIAWLISPEIDLDVNNNETLTFKTSNSFSNDSNLELLFSTDWDGTEATITSATWGILPQAYITSNDDSFVDWFDSGIVSLDCGEGTMHIAFKYTGSGDSGFDGTYELDEINIKF